MVEKRPIDEQRLGSFVAEAYRRTAPADPAGRERLERALAERVARHRRPRGPFALFARVIEPRLLFVRPAFGVATLVVTLAAGVLVGRAIAPASRTGGPAGARPQEPVATTQSPGRSVEFVLVAPQASRVSVVGDFNAWDAEATPMERHGGATVWSTRVTLPAGPHVYSFVIDGSRWVSDPVAPMTPANELGSRNSVIVVAEAPPS